VQGIEIRKLASLEERHWWYAERRRIVSRMIRNGFPSGPGPAVALDVGAAAGGNTLVLQEAGFLAIPVEYGPDGAQLASSRGLPAVRGDACSLPFSAMSTDLVLAFDVLEHIVDDRVALGEFHRVLRPEGQLWIAVPSDMRLWSAHDEAVGHVRRYSRDELIDAVRSAGFDLTDVWSWNVLLRPVVGLRRRRSTGSDLDEVARATNWILGRCVALERYLPFLRSRSGVSLILQARRTADSVKDCGTV
jgi:SAM-dependent methyltransferase